MTLLGNARVLGASLVALGPNQFKIRCYNSFFFYLCQRSRLQDTITLLLATIWGSSGYHHHHFCGPHAPALSTSMILSLIVLPRVLEDIFRAWTWTDTHIFSMPASAPPHRSASSTSIIVWPRVLEQGYLLFHLRRCLSCSVAKSTLQNCKIHNTQLQNQYYTIVNCSLHHCKIVS